MEKLLINDGLLEPTDIDGVEIRVKAFIINSDNELLIIHNNNTYQLPGGHKKKYESLEDSLEREIYEETGIDVEIKSEPFMLITEYNKNFLNSGKNICNKIYYYEVISDELPHFDRLNLTELESRTDIKINYVKIDRIEEFIEESKNNNMINDLIAYELVKAIKIYKDQMNRRVLWKTY